MSDATTTVPPWTLGWRLQRSLAWADMTMEDMAEELGIARSTVSRWCNDKGRPTRGYLKLWAQRTKVPLDWLVEGDMGLPRVDSGHRPVGIRRESTERVMRGPSVSEILSFQKRIPLQSPVGL